jgi:two-component system, OmpR family, sensor histidine kinase KdpD
VAPFSPPAGAGGGRRSEGDGAGRERQRSVTEGEEFRARIARLQQQLRSWTPEDLSSPKTAEELSGALDELEGATEDVLRRSEEAVEQERRVSRQLKEFDELRNAFLLAVSHDLQAPLAAIAALAALLQTDRLDDEQRHSVLRRLDETATGTMRLLNDLLDYQRITYGSAPINRHRMALDQLIRDAVGRVSASGHPIHLELDPITIEADPGLTERILTNLVTNAIQHTPSGTTVWVRCRREPDGALIVVEDDGPGVPPERRASVFELFEHEPGSAGTGRLGVGLALVARFAELHGGYARVEERPGGGAAFSVLLPEDAS